jgi:hypothetical protein
MNFYVGLHMPSHAKHFDRCFISVNRLRHRRGAFPATNWILDSGAFTTIAQHGGYPHPPDEYADLIERWRRVGNLKAAVAQDYMCESMMLKRTGLTVADHQRLTIERYDALLGCAPRCYVMPVLQGYAPGDYAAHVRQYGKRLRPGAWVGVGSVCKRNGKPRLVEDVLLAVKAERPDLRLHGFGLKITALRSGIVRHLLSTADSMAWSFSARKQGRNGNDWLEAHRFTNDVEGQSFQRSLIESLLESQEA